MKVQGHWPVCGQACLNKCWVGGGGRLFFGKIGLGGGGGQQRERSLAGSNPKKNTFDTKTGKVFFPVTYSCCIITYSLIITITCLILVSTLLDYLLCLLI